jgi:hypothetical protein
MAFKSPYPVQEIVTGSSTNKSKAIGKIFMDFQYLFQQKSNPVINNNARKPYYPKL